MAKKVASFRLDVDLLGWVGDYAKSRKASQAVIVEEALRHFRGVSEDGVPDLPVPDTPEVKRQRVQAVKQQGPVPGVTTAAALLRRGVDPDAMARQKRLNEAAVRARSK